MQNESLGVSPIPQVILERKELAFPELMDIVSRTAMNVKFPSSAIFALFCAITSHAAEEATARPLFNGKDLSGWKGDGYLVENGAIFCTPEGKMLVTDEIFAEYILEFDFKIPSSETSGISFHYSGIGDASINGMRLQLLDNADPQNSKLSSSQRNGSLFQLAPAKPSSLKPAGEWNHERVTVTASGLMVELNGETILRANLDEISARNPSRLGAKRRAGHIALLGNGSHVAFQNISILETPPLANIAGVMAAGYQSLFNGENLDGWKHRDSAEWSASGGILKHSGRLGTPADLWTEKDYGDFTLVFDWRWSAVGPLENLPLILPDGTEKLGVDGQPELEEGEQHDCGIYLRGSQEAEVNLWNWSAGSGEIHGYRIAPTSTPELRAATTPKVKADRPIGEWNRTMIVVKGDRVSVSLNGRVVIENASLPNLPDKGPIGLQSQGSAIDFANFWIKSK